MVKNTHKISLTLSQATEGFLLYCAGRRLSQHTIDDYANGLRHLREHFANDPNLRDIVPADISKLLKRLGTEPQQFGGCAPRKPRPLSNKTLSNIHVGLSAFWTWAVQEGAADEHIIHRVPRPKPEKRAIAPFTEEEVQRLLKACDYDAPRHLPSGSTVVNKRPTALRDRALIYTLLDTGIRISELCAATIRDLDLKNQRLKIWGKGSKERFVPLGRQTASALWRYLTTRPDREKRDPLFASKRTGRHLHRNSINLLLKRMANRADVDDVHPHRFRHTFAITFLRNGGNVYALQRTLGHTTLDMCRNYLAIVESDIQQTHKRASPVDNWDV